MCVGEGTKKSNKIHCPKFQNVLQSSMDFSANPSTYDVVQIAERTKETFGQLQH